MLNQQGLDIAEVRKWTLEIQVERNKGLECWLLFSYNTSIMNLVKYCLFLSSFLSLTCLLTAQSPVQDTVQQAAAIPTMPEFIGGVKRMNAIITENLNYPKAAWKEKVGGRVVVQFVVDKTGKIRDIQVIEGIRPDLDAEAVRLVGLLRRWKPGTMDGKEVNVRYTIPLTFHPERGGPEK